MVCTQTHLAQLAGLSQKTVNRALHGATGVNPRTAERVRRLAQQHGYRLNAAARAIRTGRFDAIGVLQSTDAGSSILNNVALWVVEEELRELKMRLVMGQIPDQSLVSGSEPNMIDAWSVDGVIGHYVFGPPLAVRRWIHRYKMPAVWMNVKLPGDCIYPDDQAAMRQSVERLLGLGHRRIALVFGYNNLHYSVADRISGYESAMREAGLEPQVVLPPGCLEGEQLYSYCREVLQARQCPSAVIVCNGATAKNLFVAAMQLGLQVPRDLSLIAFGDERIALGGLGFTMMRIPNAGVARQSVHALLKKIEQPGLVLPAEAVPFVFHEGQSCGPLR